MRASCFLAWTDSPLVSYEKFKRFAQGSRSKIDPSRKLCNNTIVWIHVPTMDCVIRHHATDILEFRPDGAIVFNIQGWFSVSTMERVRHYALCRTQFSIQNIRGERYWFRHGEWKDPVAPYTDGDTIWCDELFHSRTMEEVPIPPRPRKEKAPEPVACV